MGTLLFPKQYESRMKVLVRNERPDLMVSAGNGTPGAVPSEVTDNKINSEVELLKSNDLLSGVVRACNLDKYLPKNSSSTLLFEKAVRKLDRDLVAAPVRKSDVIQITYTAKSPELAKQVLQKLSNLYLDAHVRVHGSAGAQPFFHEQAKHYEGEMSEAAKRLNEFNRQNNIVALDSQKDVILRKATDFEAELRQSEALRAETERRNAEMERKVAGLESRVVTLQRVVPNQYSVERLNTMLAELENRRTQALLKFRPEDRAVKEIDTEITNTNAALQKSVKLQAVEEATDRNPMRAELESELARGEVQEQGLTARMGALSIGLHGFQTRLTQLDEAARFQDDLVRSFAQAKENYLMYARKEEEARIAAALDRQKISNVAIAEAPAAQHVPTSRIFR